MRRSWFVAALTLVGLLAPSAAGASSPRAAPTVTPVAQCAVSGPTTGSAIGPDRALYITDNQAGAIWRVDRDTGECTVAFSGLPSSAAPIGGPTDLVFVGRTAYVLVSLVGEFFGDSGVNGIYRMDGPSDWTVIADLGQWAIDHPPGPEIDIFIPTGVHYAIDRYKGGLVVTDGHHNKVLQVSRRGRIRQLLALPNVVPTGLETRGDKVLVALAGPAPHLPEDGQVVEFEPGDDEIEVVASGGPLMLDVERGRHGLFGLAQGIFPVGSPDGTPAIAGTGQLLRLEDGEARVIVDELNQPTSMEIVGRDAYVLSIDGSVTKVSGVGR